MQNPPFFFETYFDSIKIKKLYLKDNIGMYVGLNEAEPINNTIYSFYKMNKKMC